MLPKPDWNLWAIFCCLLRSLSCNRTIRVTRSSLAFPISPVVPSWISVASALKSVGMSWNPEKYFFMFPVKNLFYTSTSFWLIRRSRRNRNRFSWFRRIRFVIKRWDQIQIACCRVFAIVVWVAGVDCHRFQFFRLFFVILTFNNLKVFSSEIISAEKWLTFSDR